MATTTKKLRTNQFALYVNKGDSSSPEYIRMEKSSTLSIAFNPETEDTKYIADEVTTTSLTAYKPQIAQDLSMYKGSDDYEYFFGKAFALDVDDILSDIILVFYGEPGSATDTYKAWKTNANFIFDSLDATADVLNFNINFTGNIMKGEALMTSGKPVFTEK